MEFLKNVPFDLESPIYLYYIAPILQSWLFLPIIIIIDFFFIIKLVTGSWHLRNITKKEIIKIFLIAILINFMYVGLLLISNLKIFPFTFGIKNTPVSLFWYLFIFFFSIFGVFFDLIASKIFGHLDLPIMLLLSPVMLIILIFIVFICVEILTFIKSIVIKFLYKKIRLTKIIYWIATANIISIAIVVILSIYNFKTTSLQEPANHAQKASIVEQSRQNQQPSINY